MNQGCTRAKLQPGVRFFVILTLWFKAAAFPLAESIFMPPRTARRPESPLPVKENHA